MKQLMLLLCCSGALAYAADLGTAKTVYVLSMPHGMDQFLANRLTNDHVFQVVTDPKMADIILTDHLGEAFQAKLELISPTPEPVKEPAKDDTDQADQPPQNPYLSDVANKVPIPITAPFGRNKGTLFIVDAKSRQVLWSIFEPAKSFSDKDLDRTASDIVSRLKKDLKRK